MGEKEKRENLFLNWGGGGEGLLHYSPLIVVFLGFFFTFQLYGIEALFGFNSQMNI
jgi:hypothetical protein